MAKKLLGFFNKQKQFEQDVMENGMQYSSFYGDSLRRLKKNKMAMFCACVLILLALMAIFAPLLAPYDPTYQDYSAVLGGPCKACLLYTSTRVVGITMNVIPGNAGVPVPAMMSP